MSTFKKNRGIVLGVVILSLGLMVLGSYKANAESPAAFYRDKTIHWVVSSGAGGTTDLMSRITAQYLGKKIGAKIRVENMGRNKGLNYVFTKGGRDGLTLVSKARTALVLNDVAKAPGLRYKCVEFNYIADMMIDAGAVFVRPGSPYGSVEALQKAKGLKAGGTSARGFFATSASVLFDIMGLDGKVIPGYKGPMKLFFALGQDEINFIAYQAAAGLKKIKDGTIEPVFVFSRKRFAALPDVPTLEELGVKIPADLEDAYNLVGKSGQAVMAPPGVPADRVAFLQDVFQELSNDAGLQSEFEKTFQFFVPFEHGKEMEANIKKIMANRNLSEQLKGIVETYTAAR
jgi:tripartite-type tricarboxylate transporter receptor subunit TctC